MIYQNQKKSLKLGTTKSMSLKQSLIVLYTAKSQASTTSFHAKAIQKKKVLESIHWQLYIFENL